MRSGSPAHDDHGWPSPQRPYPDEANGPARYGPRPGDPHQARDVPFGPEVSWPQGFRPLDTGSRELLESVYRGPDPGPAPRRPAEGPRPDRGSAYQQPAMDDYGYGDPGYSDPSYDGPRNQHTGPQPSFPAAPTGPAFPGGAAFPPATPFAGGTGSPGSRWYSGGPASRGTADIYPVTGAQEALPDTGPRPRAGYPEEWYGHPRLNDRVLDDAAGPRAADPRLEGIRYDELRYDEPERPGYDEQLDDESWVKELRRDRRPGPSGFLSAPPSPVGVLAPPAGTPPVAGDAFLAGPSAAPFLPPSAAPEVRPGHGLDGPEITTSWPAQPSSEDLAFDEFWHEDDGEGDGEYSRLFGDEADPDEADAKPARRRTGRRRGRSNDHRLWLALGGVVAVTAAAVVGVLKFELPSHGGGPVHAMATPAHIGSYLRKPGLERQTDLAALRAQVIKMSSGQASRVVSAVYESGDSTAGGSVQMVMFIGGHLANAGPDASISGFTQQFPGANVVSAGPQGGKAACVEEQAGSADSKSICVWFDNDSFGTLVSPTMNAPALANVMRTIRPSVETTVKE